MKRTAWFTAAASGIAVMALAALVLLPAQGTISASHGPEVTTDSSPAPDLAPGSAQLRATINPETGGVDVSTTVTAAPLDAETAQALRRDTEGLEQVYHPDGSVSVNLQGRFQNVSVVRIDKNGKLVICSEEIDQIDGVIQNRPDTAPAAVQELEVR